MSISAKLYQIRVPHRRWIWIGIFNREEATTSGGAAPTQIILWTPTLHSSECESLENSRSATLVVGTGKTRGI